MNHETIEEGVLVDLACARKLVPLAVLLQGILFLPKKKNASGRAFNPARLPRNLMVLPSVGVGS